MIHKSIIFFLIFLIFFGLFPNFTKKNKKKQKINTCELIFNHIGDSYEWHILPFKKQYAIPLPIIVKGKTSGWHIFLSNRFRNGNKSYKNFSIARTGMYKNKIIEILSSKRKIRPLDLSLTKNALSLILSNIILLTLILYCSRWYKKREGKPEKNSPKGFITFVELTIIMVIDNIINPCLGKNHQFYTSYLLTIFFFIILNNLLGLIPIFPLGVNITGNIAVTCVLALYTFIYANIFGTKKYWIQLFWPDDVPLWLKIPIPIISIIEIIGIVTKPLALMIRLFANISAGHIIILSLAYMIIEATKCGTICNTGIALFSFIMLLFINYIELLVACIQAYIFTILSSVFISLSQIKPVLFNKNKQKITYI